MPWNRAARTDAVQGWWQGSTRVPAAGRGILTGTKEVNMVRLELALELSYEVFGAPADFIFNIHAARTRHQTVVAEELVITPALRSGVHTVAASCNRYLRFTAERGPLTVRYNATVDIAHHLAVPQDLPEVPVADLPADALGYVYPSRYCQSDRLGRLANREFGDLPRGYARVVAIRDWVRRNVAFTSNTSNATTSAVDTLVDRAGVCRDFAHLMIALCRALNIPARFTTGIDFGADPALGPTDFHAYVEVFLGDRWYMFDPSGTAIPMGFVRFGTGRDAADVAFAMIFGSVASQAPVIHVEAVVDAAQGFVMPVHSDNALSTDGGAG
jgi:transglutaminase-like putative cysteine protease